MNKDQTEGRSKQAKGKDREVAGRVIGDGALEEKGRVEKVVGKIQAGYGDLKDDLMKGI